MSSTSRARQRRGLRAAPDEAGHTRRVAHHVPGVVVERHAHEQVAGEDLLLHDDLAAVLELDDVFHRDDDLEDPLLDVHGTHPAREVLLHLVLVAGVGVHDVPGARPVVGAGLRFLVFVLVFVDHVDELGVGQIDLDIHLDDDRVDFTVAVDVDRSDHRVDHAIAVDVDRSDDGIDRTVTIHVDGLEDDLPCGRVGVVGVVAGGFFGSHRSTIIRRGRERTSRMRSRTRR